MITELIIRRQSRKWLLCLGISFLALTMTYVPEGLALFRYDRVAISSGQEWRLVTGHLVHLNTFHLFLNLAGLFLLTELLWGDLPVLHGAGLFVASSAGISILLWQLHPELDWYAGLSGTLHALWAGCVIFGLLQSIHGQQLLSTDQRTHFSTNKLASLVGMLLLIMKLGIEWRYGPSDRTEQIIGAPVVTAAHLYGALIGTVYVLVWRAGRLLQNGNCI